MRVSRTRFGVGAAAALTLIVSVGGAASATSPRALRARTVRGTALAAEQPCGAAAAGVVARTALAAANAIYSGELSGPRSRQDRAQVEGDVPLQEAAATHGRRAVREAVHRLVYSHTHIVRLRVTRGAAVLADVGGPYILAPVGGVLRFHGRVVAHYLLSVQDDAGFAKLEHRFVGYPVVLRRGSTTLRVEESVFSGPPSLPALGQVRFRHATYEAASFLAKDFPRGVLRISLLTQIRRSLQTRTCREVRGAEVARIAEHTATAFRRFLPAVFVGVYVHLVANLTGALVFVREGDRQLAGTSTGPASLPESGSVSYAGATYEVASFSMPNARGLRVYTLAP